MNAAIVRDMELLPAQVGSQSGVSGSADGRGAVGLKLTFAQSLDNAQAKQTGTVPAAAEDPTPDRSAQSGTRVAWAQSPAERPGPSQDAPSPRSQGGVASEGGQSEPSQDDTDTGTASPALPQQVVALADPSAMPTGAVPTPVQSTAAATEMSLRAAGASDADEPMAAMAPSAETGLPGATVAIGPRAEVPLVVAQTEDGATPPGVRREMLQAQVGAASIGVEAEAALAARADVLPAQGTVAPDASAARLPLAEGAESIAAPEGWRFVARPRDAAPPAGPPPPTPSATENGQPAAAADRPSVAPPVANGPRQATPADGAGTEPTAPSTVSDGVPQSETSPVVAARAAVGDLSRAGDGVAAGSGAPDSPVTGEGLVADTPDVPRTADAMRPSAPVAERPEASARPEPQPALPDQAAVATRPVADHPTDATAPGTDGRPGAQRQAAAAVQVGGSAPSETRSAVPPGAAHPAPVNVPQSTGSAARGAAAEQIFGAAPQGSAVAGLAGASAPEAAQSAATEASQSAATEPASQDALGVIADRSPDVVTPPLARPAVATSFAVQTVPLRATALGRPPSAAPTAQQRGTEATGTPSDAPVTEPSAASAGGQRLTGRPTFIPSQVAAGSPSGRPAPGAVSASVTPVMGEAVAIPTVRAEEMAQAAAQAAVISGAAGPAAAARPMARAAAEVRRPTSLAGTAGPPVATTVEAASAAVAAPVAPVAAPGSAAVAVPAGQEQGAVPAPDADGGAAVSARSGTRSQAGRPEGYADASTPAGPAVAATDGAPSGARGVSRSTQRDLTRSVASDTAAVTVMDTAGTAAGASLVNTLQGVTVPLPAETQALAHARQVVEEVTRLGDTGRGDLHIDLDWEDIGVSHLSVRVEDGRARLQFTCTSPESVAHLRTLEAPIRQTLEAGGMRLEDFAANYGGERRQGSGQSAEQAQWQSDAASARTAVAAAVGSRAPRQGAHPSGGPAQRRTEDGRLDVLV